METNDVVARWTADALLPALASMKLSITGEEVRAWLGDKDAAEYCGMEAGRPRSLAEVYEQLHRADWWLWVAIAAGVDRRRVALAACACARTALRYMPEGEPNSHRVIELTERWARGEPEVTLEHVESAFTDVRRVAQRASPTSVVGGVASAAISAANTARAVIPLTGAARAVIPLTGAACGAAWDAAIAFADATVGADARIVTWRSARAKALADMMPLVRELLPLEVVAKALTESCAPTKVASAT